MINRHNKLSVGLRYPHSDLRYKLSVTIIYKRFIKLNNPAHLIIGLKFNLICDRLSYERQSDSHTKTQEIIDVNIFQMQNWYENRTLLNIFIIAMVTCFIAYYFYNRQWGLPLFLSFGTAIMIRGVVKITMRMRRNNPKHKSQNKELE